jgi:hypothetical protein
MNKASPVVLEGLVKAVRFYEQVKRENPPVETGAWKDAVDWVLKEACQTVNIGVKVEGPLELTYDATKFDQALLINKFYERYPLSEFKNDSERADALGYFMAGAELQRLGHFIEYNDKDDSDEY